MKIDLETMKLPDLKKLQASIEAEILLRSSETPSGNRYSLFHHWYQALKDVLWSDHGISIPPAAVFAKMGHAKTFTSAIPSCEKLLEQYKRADGSVLRRPQEMSVRCTIFRTLFIWMKVREVPISIATVCRNMQNAQAAVAAEFPGYLQNGLLHLLVK